MPSWCNRLLPLAISANLSTPAYAQAPSAYANTIGVTRLVDQCIFGSFLVFKAHQTFFSVPPQSYEDTYVHYNKDAEIGNSLRTELCQDGSWNYLDDYEKSLLNQRVEAHNKCIGDAANVLQTGSWSSADVYIQRSNVDLMSIRAIIRAGAMGRTAKLAVQEQERQKSVSDSLDMFSAASAGQVKFTSSSVGFERKSAKDIAFDTMKDKLKDQSDYQTEEHAVMKEEENAVIDVAKTLRDQHRLPVPLANPECN